MDRTKDTFESQVQGQEHVLLTKYDRKLRKLIGLDGKEMAPDDSVTIVGLSARRHFATVSANCLPRLRRWRASMSSHHARSTSISGASVERPS